MVAIILYFQCYSENDTADIIITNTFINSEKIVENLRKQNVFNNVHYAKSIHYINPGTFRGKVRKIKFMISYKKEVLEVLNGDSFYDELYYNCEDLFLFNLASVLRKQNEKCILNRFEEGYSTYIKNVSSSQKSKRIIKMRNKIQRIFMDGEFDNLYLLEPELLLNKNQKNIKKIEGEISKTENYRKCISKVFGTDKLVHPYTKQFIIFEESFSNDGFIIDDISIFSEIIGILGADNVSVKLHPRSKNNRFEKFNVDLHEADGIPWEAILLTCDLKSVTLITMASGSVINSRLLFKDKTKAVLMYKCLKEKPPLLDEKFDLFIDKFSRKCEDGVFVPQNIEEVRSLINQNI